MGITRINTNISAITAQNNIRKTGSQLAKSIERLSSGLRINRAGDDAAGMIVANRLRTQVLGIDTAINNAQDGINLINVAEGALQESTVRLNRVRELALQAANTAVNDLSTRAAIQDEIFQNIDEITRIANTTQFASNHLLNGNFSIQSDIKKGQDNIGLSIDTSPVASTLSGGRAFLNIRQTQQPYAQLSAGDGIGEVQLQNTGIANQTDIAVSVALFTSTMGDLTSAVAADGAISAAFFNGISISATDTFVYEGVLADGRTTFVGTYSIGAGNISDLASDIQVAINQAEFALFGVGSAGDVPSAYKTSVSFSTSASNRGRLEFQSAGGTEISQTDFSINLIRSNTIVGRAEGITRSGAFGLDSGISGVGQVGNSVSAITGSTFATGQFKITVSDVQQAQQRKLESAIVFRDSNGAIIDRSVSIGAGGGSKSLVLNGTFDNSVYTGGTTLQSGDTIILNGINADGSTFESTFTFNAAATVNFEDDTSLNDFTFNTVSGLITELNYRTRDYSTGSITDGDQSRFEDAIFTFGSSGTLQLIDDFARDDSQLGFTLTFQGSSNNTLYTLQDQATLTQEGFAESASFSIDKGESIRANAGEVITLFGAIQTREDIPQEQVTLRVGSSFTAGTDILDNHAAEYSGSLNGGPSVTFSPGAQDVVFVSGTNANEPSQFVTIDFDSTIDVTSSGDQTDTGVTLMISTLNQSLNFQIGPEPNQSLRFALGGLQSSYLGFGFGSGRTIQDIIVTTLEGANSAIEIVDEALDQVTRMRSMLGATSNRLEATIANLSVTSENLSASESRIRDADIAIETTRLAKNQVLLQAGLSVLAQSNLQSRGLLELIG